MYDWLCMGYTAAYLVGLKPKAVLPAYYYLIIKLCYKLLCM